MSTNNYGVKTKLDLTVGASPLHLHLTNEVLGYQAARRSHRVIFTNVKSANTFVLEGSASSSIPDPGPGPGGSLGISFVDGGGGNDKILDLDGGDFVALDYHIGGRVTVANASSPSNDDTYGILDITTTSTANDTLEIASGSINPSAGDTSAELQAERNGRWVEIGNVNAADGFVDTGLEPPWPHIRVNHSVGSQIDVVIDVISKHVPATMRRH